MHNTLCIIYQILFKHKYQETMGWNRFVIIYKISFQTFKFSVAVVLLSPLLSSSLLLSAVVWAGAMYTVARRPSQLVQKSRNRAGQLTLITKWQHCLQLSSFQKRRKSTRGSILLWKWPSIQYLCVLLIKWSLWSDTKIQLMLYFGTFH